jgi:SAM-dependent methyltransferase
MALMTRFSGRRIRRLRNLAFDLRSGGLRRGNVPSRHSEGGAQDVVNTDITALERIFDDRIEESDVLVDVGCGKGRVIAWWLRNGVGTRVVGLELDEEIAEETRRRLRKHPNVSIVTGNAIENVPADGSLFYIHNPFGEALVRELSERMKQIHPDGRGVRILYYNPVHAAVFRSDPSWTVEDVTIGGDSFHALCAIELRPSDERITEDPR